MGWSIDWPNVIAGAIVGLFPVVAWNTASVLKILSSSRARKYRGTFNLYHWSGTTDTLRHKIVRFSPSIRNGLEARILKDEFNKLTFSGKVFQGRRGVMYAAMLGEGTTAERVFLAFHDPINPEFMFTRGIMLSVNFLAQPMAWRFVLSRSELTQQDAVTLLGDRTLLDARQPNVL